VVTTHYETGSAALSRRVRRKEQQMKRVQRRGVSPAKVVAVVGVLAVAGLGSSLASAVAAGWSSGQSTGTASVVVKVASTKLGKIIVGPNGHALYLYKADKGTTSECYAGCASAWPPLLTAGKPKGGTGVLAAKLGTTKRTGGKLQVTYAGHPLYYFAGDSAAGQTSGQGSGGTWYVLSPAGSEIK
jgi:predicted lipoprotein with Yx(FWY)xxD motif